MAVQDIPIVMWLLIGAVVLLLIRSILQDRTVNILREDQEQLRAWALGEDPDYWRELLGPEDSLGLVNDDPEPDGPPECQGIHPVAKDGKTCSNCGIDVPVPVEAPQA